MAEEKRGYEKPAFTKVPIDPSETLPPAEGEGEPVPGVLMETEPFQPHTGDYEELDRLGAVGAGLDSIELELTEIEKKMPPGGDEAIGSHVDEIGDTIKGLRESLEGFEQSSLFAVLRERARQNEKWGGIPKDDTNTLDDWVRWIKSRANVLELVSLTCDDDGVYDADYAADLQGDFTLRIDATPEKVRKMFVEIAALALAALEAHDRFHADPPTPK